MKVSIIVPCYSVASKLPRCVHNLLAQTFTDWELILIDDGSTDNTWDICNSFTKNNAHIHAVHKENGGVSSARNTGIEIAILKFVIFTITSCLRSSLAMHPAIKLFPVPTGPQNKQPI